MFVCLRFMFAFAHRKHTEQMYRYRFIRTCRYKSGFSLHFIRPAISLYPLHIFADERNIHSYSSHRCVWQNERITNCSLVPIMCPWSISLLSANFLNWAWIVWMELNKLVECGRLNVPFNQNVTAKSRIWCDPKASQFGHFRLSRYR